MRFHVAVMAAVLACAPVVQADQAPQFVFRDGSVQIGSAPGRVNMARPRVHHLMLGDRVQYSFTVNAPTGVDPCGDNQHCHATVGLRHWNAQGSPFTEVWSTFSMPPDFYARAVTLDLSSTAPANALPAGRCQLIVSIVRGEDVLFEHAVPVVVP